MTASPVPAAALVQAFFVEHLLNQKHASPRTLAAYRDAFRLLLRFIHQTHGIEPATLNVENLDTPVILAFLDHLEQQRSNSIRSRNARLAAIRSFFRFVQMREPAAVAVASRVLAIPAKRAERKLIGYLTRSEIDALLSAADQTCWDGRRDHALLLTLYNSGARVSEIIGVRRDELVLDAPASLKLHGKGRKERAVPLWTKTAQILRPWLQELGDRFGGLAFPSARARRLSRHGVSFLVNRLADRATATCPSLGSKRISPHVVRHSTAMHLLQPGVDPAVIALWLGHESVETTHGYVEADLTMMENAMGKLAPAGSTRSIQGFGWSPGRRPCDYGESMDTKHHLSFVASITESLTQHNPVLNIRSTCAQLKSTHTKNTLFPDFASGQRKSNPRRRASYSPVIHSFFPKQFVFSAVAQLAAGVLLPGGKAATVPVWSWVNFGERSMIISRAPKPEFAFHIGIRLGRRLPLGLAQFLDQPEASEGTETGSEAADHRRQWATVGHSLSRRF